MRIINRPASSQRLVSSCLTNHSLLQGFIFILALGLSSWGNALRFEPTDEIMIDLDTTVSYGAMWRVEKMDKRRQYGPNDIVNWPKGPGLIDTSDLADGIQTWNSDDGNRNFEKGDMTSSRFAVISDFDLAYKNVGIFMRGRAFYDSVYFEETSWDGEGWDHFINMTVADCMTQSLPTEQCGYQGAESINNTYAAGLISDPSHFSDRAKDVHGSDIGFLDAYVYGVFNIGDSSLDLRIGRQAISWGESLMLQGGIGFAQNRIDVSAATAPGQQLKEIFLPTGTVFGQVDLTPEITLEAYWQYEWKKSVLMASDSYFGFTDFLDTGIFLVSANATQNCMYGFTDVRGTGAGVDCDVYFVGPGGSGAVYAPPQAMYQSPDLEPDKPQDQFGVALRFLLENGSEAGLYFLQYHDRYPSFWASNRGGEFRAADAIAGNEETGFNTQHFTIEYAERIKMIGMTYNTVFGDIQMGFELTYRENQPVVPHCSVKDMAATTSTLADNDASNQVIGDPAFGGGGVPGAVGDLDTAAAQALINTNCKDRSVHALARKSYWGKDVVGFVGASESVSGWNVGTGGSLQALNDKLLSWPNRAEMWTYNIGATAVVPPTPFWDTGILVAEIGGWYVGSDYEDKDLRCADIGCFTAEGVGVSAIFLPQYKNVWSGIDLTLPVFVNYGVDGSFAYFNYRKDALWFAIGAEAIYLSNTTFGVTYNTYGGTHAWKDRDNVSFNVKYTF